MDCKGCGEHGEPQKIPYIAYETECARHDRTVKRLWIVIIVCIALIFASNAIWLYVANQYEFETVDYSQDGRGINIIGNDNETRQSNGTETTD